MIVCIVIYPAVVCGAVEVCGYTDSLSIYQSIYLEGDRD